MPIPPDLMTNIRQAQQLERQRQHNSEDIFPLIEIYKQILERLQLDDEPALYAAIQYNLGNAYRELPTGDRASNLTQAIACYQQALRFRTADTTPLDYATTQNNLGNAYSELPTGDRASNLTQAIACYQQALRFQTPEAEPFECRRTTRNLAGLYFVQEAWEAARRTYRDAIDVGERLYQVGLTTTSKAAEISENSALYSHPAILQN